MKLLLDTHLAAWSLTNDVRLAEKAHELISNPENEIVISVVVLWEIAIKRALSRSDRDNFRHSARTVYDLFTQNEATILSVTPAHTFAVEQLPPLHRDPFDRLLVAQALSEPLRLVTHDSRVAAYSDTVILV